MDSLDLSKIDIVASINTTSILESNIFLRRFYNEISAQVPLGWYYHPYRNGNIVYVGDSNYGEMWFDYEVKGCIKNIYFKSRDKEKHEYITNIIEKIMVSELFITTTIFVFILSLLMHSSVRCAVTTLK